jgi:hypothetical protein
MTILLQGLEDHIQRGSLLGFIFVQHCETGSHGEFLMQVFSIAAGQDDDPVFAQAF